METCVTFDLSKELVYDANTGTCTLGADGIDLKRPQENSCRVPTAQLSVKMAFGAGDSNTVHIDFSSNGGSTFYTEEEGGQTRLAVPASLFERNLQTAGTCQDCGETIFNVGYKQGIRAPWSGQSARQDTWHYQQCVLRPLLSYYGCQRGSGSCWYPRRGGRLRPICPDSTCIQLQSPRRAGGP